MQSLEAVRCGSRIVLAIVCPLSSLGFGCAEVACSHVCDVQYEDCLEGDDGGASSYEAVQCAVERNQCKAGCQQPDQ